MALSERSRRPFPAVSHCRLHCTICQTAHGLSQEIHLHSCSLPTSQSVTPRPQSGGSPSARHPAAPQLQRPARSTRPGTGCRGRSAAPARFPGGGGPSPWRKGSMSTSALLHSRLSAAAPCGRFRSSAKERFPRACTSPCCAPAAGRDRRSIRTTCAPKSARIIPQSGAGASPASSSTRTPPSAIVTGSRCRAPTHRSRCRPGGAPPSLAQPRGTGRAPPGPASARVSSPRARDSLRAALPLSAPASSEAEWAFSCCWGRLAADSGETSVSDHPRASHPGRHT